MKEIKCPKCGEVFQVDESGYAAIVKQVRDKEFEKELSDRKAQFDAEKQAAVKLMQVQTMQQMSEEISSLKQQLAASQSKLKAQAEAEESRLSAQLAAKENAQKLETEKLISQKEKEIAQKEREIGLLSGKIETVKQESLLREQGMKDGYEERLRLKDEQIAYYRDFKARQSTKMVGESLEQHCEIEFNRLRATGFQNAYFEKDNDARSGSKGDYIYREFDSQQIEFISIMFEMKNEMDETATKKKNEDFLKELDKAAGDGIRLLAGAGINASAVQTLLASTGITQYHMSGKTVKNSGMQYRNPSVSMGIPGMSEYDIWQTDPCAVRSVRSLLDAAAGSQTL